MEMTRYFAEIVDDVVVRVIVCEYMELAEKLFGGTWVETFMDKPDHNYAGKGYKYISTYKNFLAPKPMFETTTGKIVAITGTKMNAQCKWEIPVAYPVMKEGDKMKRYLWDVTNKVWVEKVTKE